MHHEKKNHQYSIWVLTILVCESSFGLKMHIENATFEKAKEKKRWNLEKIPTQCGAGQPAAYEVYTVCIHKRRAYSFFLASPYCVLQSL